MITCYRNIKKKKKFSRVYNIHHSEDILYKYNQISVLFSVVGIDNVFSVLTENRTVESSNTRFNSKYFTPLKAYSEMR